MIPHSKRLNQCEYGIIYHRGNSDTTCKVIQI